MVNAGYNYGCRGYFEGFAFDFSALYLQAHTLAKRLELAADLRAVERDFLRRAPVPEISANQVDVFAASVGLGEGLPRFGIADATRGREGDNWRFCPALTPRLAACLGPVQLALDLGRIGLGFPLEFHCVNVTSALEWCSGNIVARKLV